MKRYVITILYLTLIFINSVSLKAQNDSLNIGRTVTSPKIINYQQLNPCHPSNISTIERQLLDSLAMYNNFIRRLERSYLLNNNCFAKEFLNQRLLESQSALDLVCSKIFILKPNVEYLDTKSKLALQHCLMEKINDCNFYSDVTENELSDHNSNVNKILFYFFKSKREHIENELKSNKNECYKQNLTHVLNILKYYESIK